MKSDSPTFEPSLPLSGDGYVRTFEATIDDNFKTEVRVRGTLTDHRCSIEHEWVLRVPEYEVLEASARHLQGEPEVLAPELTGRYADIRGVRIARGFTRTVRDALGDLNGRRDHITLAIEMARAGQQVYKLPKGFDNKFEQLAKSISRDSSRRARVLWEQDRAYMPDLPNSCHTYNDRSVQLFEEREVYCPDYGNLMNPEPGQLGVFERKKRMKISKPDGSQGFLCENEMNDTIHEMQIEFNVGPDGSIKQAHSEGTRFPFHGICEDAQQRTPGLNGRQITKDFVRLLADQVGGATGCTHLFDLSVDCLRFFDWK